MGLLALGSLVWLSGLLSSYTLGCAFGLYFVPHEHSSLSAT